MLPTVQLTRFKRNFLAVYCSSLPWQTGLITEVWGEANSPGVKLVNDALEANDSEEPGAETSQPGQEQDGERQQGLPPGWLRQAAG